MLRKGIFLLFFLVTAARAQTVPLSVLKADSATTGGLEQPSSAIDAVVYSAAVDSILFNFNDKTMDLYGKSVVHYKATSIKSHKIRISLNSNLMDATGGPDSSGKKLIGEPLLSDGTDGYRGSEIKYNYKTGRGIISMARNLSKSERYSGDQFLKLDKQSYLVAGGKYSTCEDDTPHYYFAANKMKVLRGDKIIAKWIWLYIEDVPVPVPLPFAVFPTQSGRRSGIIPPGYSQDANKGQSFRNFGYFWAINDYMDLALTSDYFSRGGYGFRERYRYHKRYNYSGYADAGYSYLYSGEKTDRDYSNSKEWNFSLTHNQTITPSSRLDLNLRFMSSNYLSQNSLNQNDLLSQTIVSNASYSNYWQASGTSLSLNYSRSQDLKTGDLHEIMPSLNFNLSEKYPFKRKNSLSSDTKWYELLGVNYSGEFENKRDQTGGDVTSRAGAEHNINIDIAPKVGHISISPTIQYSELWYSKSVKKEDIITRRASGDNDSVVTRDCARYSMVRQFSLGLGATTRLYGIFNPGILGIESFRHTLSPTISFNFKPDFSDDFWGYYDYYTDSKGRRIKYSRFEREVFGGPSEGKTQSLGFSLGNIFEMKTKKNPNDTTSQTTKYQLLNLSADFSYNFAADSLRLSDLHLSYRTQIGRFLNFYGSSSYSFYADNGYNKINRTLISEGRGLAKMTYFSLSLSTTISGEKLKGRKDSEKENKTENSDEFSTFKKSNYVALYDENPPDFSIPWNLSAGYNYTFSRPAERLRAEMASLYIDIGMNLTQSWKFSLRGSYDINNHQVSAPEIRINKDLHCWEMNLVWNPTGRFAGYRFEIRLKASQLQDLKLTKSRGLYSGWQ